MTVLLGGAVGGGRSAAGERLVCCFHALGRHMICVANKGRSFCVLVVLLYETLYVMLPGVALTLWNLCRLLR